LYPNPTNGKFSIKVNEALSNQAILINIYDVNGQLYKSIDEDIIDTIDITDLPNGVYMVQLVSQDFTEIKKLIKH